MITHSSLVSLQPQCNPVTEFNFLTLSLSLSSLRLDCWWFVSSPRCSLVISPPWQRSWRSQCAATQSPSSSSAGRTSPTPSWWLPCPAETSAGNRTSCGLRATAASRRPRQRSPCVRETSCCYVSAATSPPRVRCKFTYSGCHSLFC